MNLTIVLNLSIFQSFYIKDLKFLHFNTETMYFISINKYVYNNEVQTIFSSSKYKINSS